MILIADSGSTKTHWCLYDPKSETKIKELHTNGINPFYQTEVQIADEVFTNVHSKLPVYEIESIYFYGAGCSFPEKKEILSKAISISFPVTSMVAYFPKLPASFMKRKFPLLPFTR